MAMFWGGERARIHSLGGFTEIRSTHERSGELTKHPVEKGAQIADHFIPGTWQLMLELMVTDTPLDDGTVDTDDGTVTAVGSASVARPGYSIDFLHRLNQLWEDRQLITVVTAARTYDNMVLVSISDPVDVNIGINAKRITCRFEEVVIVVAKVTAPVLTADPRGQRRRRTGTKSGKPLSFIPGGNAVQRAFNEAILFGTVPGGNALWAARPE